MSPFAVSPEYAALVKKFPPKVIGTEEENGRYREILYDMDRRSRKLRRAEKELAKLLTLLLIEGFEAKHRRLVCPAQ